MNQNEFLDEIERDMQEVIEDIACDGNYHGGELIPLMDKIKAYLDDNVHWNTAAHLPTPNIPLIIKLSDGTEVIGTRPAYVVSRQEGDLGYRDVDGKTLMNVLSWSIR